MIKMLRDRKGQGLVEYALLVAGIALVGILAVSIIGEKTGDMLGMVAVILPGADGDDNSAIGQGHLIEDTGGSAGQANQIDVKGIMSNSGTSRLGNNLVGANIGNGGTPLIVDAVPQGGGS